MTILLHSKSRILLSAILVGVAYYFLCQLGTALSTPPEYIASFWPANSVILVALLFTDKRYWWVFILVLAPTSIIPVLQADYSLTRSIIFYFANAAEVLIAAFALKPILGNDIRLDRFREMILFILWAVFIAPIISALIASIVSFYEAGISYWLIWRAWFLADALGHLALTPVIILFISNGLSWRRKESLVRLGEALILVLCLTIVGFLALGAEMESKNHLPALLYIPVPILLWVAIRFGPLGICTSVLILTIMATWNAFNGQGPFVGNTSEENALSLQLFLFSVSIPMMLIGTLFSERKQSEKKLDQHSKQLKAILDSSAAVIYTLTSTGNSDRPFKITYISENIEDLTGYKVSTWYSDETLWIDHLHPDDRDRALANQDVLLKKDKLTHEYRFLCKDGSYVWIRDELLPILKKDETGEIVEIIGTWINITEQKQVDNKLRSSEEKYRAIFETSQVGMALCKMDGTLVDINQGYLDIVGYSKEEVLNLTYWDITPRKYEEQEVKQLQSLSETGHFGPYEKEYIHKDGSYIPVLLNGSKVKGIDSDNYIWSIVHDIGELKHVNEKLSYQASHDALTGLVNRREFERRIERLLSTIQEESDGGHALCFMDLDQFKVVNDTCGHRAGDEMLRQISAVLQRVIRHRDTLARLGGDEFGVLMEYCSLDDAHRVAASLQKAIQDYNFLWEGHTFRVGVSIGLVPITETAPSLNELLKEADAACYVAKEKGRNRIHVYHAEDSEIEKRHGEMQWVERLYHALDEDRFCLYAQIIAPLKGGTDIHYELLIRMIDEQGKMVSPDTFLPAAERYNLISRIDLWVIEKTFSLLKENPGFLEKINFCSINLSGPSLTDPNILDFIIALLDSTGIEGKKICFEITETAAISNLTSAMTFISSLKNLGCRFALDDFGSGLSSFAYLKNLPVDFLKIDGMFVKDIADDPIDHAMVKSINEIGHVMEMETIAEFVENDVIKGMLKEIGVDYAQGYGIGKPQPLDELFKKPG
jgi:diguanylate cyclase (GGDEF)-like protein/PAS domain S-box-containing protein